VQGGASLNRTPKTLVQYSTVVGTLFDQVYPCSVHRLRCTSLEARHPGRLARLIQNVVRCLFRCRRRGAQPVQRARCTKFSRNIFERYRGVCINRLGSASLTDVSTIDEHQRNTFPRVHQPPRLHFSLSKYVYAELLLQCCLCSD
jgi:hypothetical protein